MDAHFRGFAQSVVPLALERKIGVRGMKCFGSGVILKSSVVQPMDCLHYSLNVPLTVLITGINSQEQLDQAFTAVKTFRPLNESEVAILIAKTEAVAMQGKYELFKTSAHFDTTARHPDWLGSDSPDVQKLAPQLPG
jgi:hypothetical protein